jgi:phosphatidylserine/phosphatidylglycerophosphate/cardiolipin synthase-like enzyme
MSTTMPVRNSHEGLTVSAYRGDGNVLLAFDLAAPLTPHLAGFAILCDPPNRGAYWVRNRLSFADPITNASPGPGRYVSYEAPFQKFRWVHFPTDPVPGFYRYTVTAMYFANGGLRRGPSVELPIELQPAEPDHPRFQTAFTRGFVSSQAYVDRFENKPLQPKKRSIDFDTGTYDAQYRWLGYHARELIFQFLDDCLADPTTTVDAFAYDLNEPEIIRKLQQFGPRLRIILDNAALHTKETALERKAAERLIASAGAGNVVLGHFSRFAHHKLFIQKRDGQPVRVLTGSANFSVRGLYVQANNVLLFDEPGVAALFEQAFEQAFTDMGGFQDAPIAAGWHAITAQGVPAGAVAFSPHKAANVSLGRAHAAMRDARSSVLYAVMELKGTGPVLAGLRELGGRPDIFSYGITEASGGFKLYKPGEASGIFTPFAYLKDKVPAPFKREWSGGSGQVIHHKFVVVDFNDAEPVVFTGSSNLAARGEEVNGDNLLAIEDRSVAGTYAVEAIRLVDHFHFRAAMAAATTAEPLRLKHDAEQWWAPYYDPAQPKFRDRQLFSR